MINLSISEAETVPFGRPIATTGNVHSGSDLGVAGRFEFVMGRSVEAAEPPAGRLRAEDAIGGQQRFASHQLSGMMRAPRGGYDERGTQLGHT